MSAIQREGVGMPPAELFQRTLFQTVTLPWKSVRLEPTTLDDYAGRAASQRLAVGELYHENSKLFPQHPALVAAAAASRSETRAEFVRRRAQAAAGDAGEPPAATVPLLALVRRAAGALDPEALYGLELRLVVADRLWACEPSTCRLRLIRALEPEALTRLERAIAPGEAAAHLADGRALLAVIGSFARSEILLGSRGYRRTVLDAGRFAGALEALRDPGGPTVTPVLEFYDRVVDDVVEVDGLEQGTLALLIAGGVDGSRESQAQGHRRTAVQ